MPFTIDGQWVPSKIASKAPQKPVKVRVVKRGQSILTVILNLNMPPSDLASLASSLKKKLGCGGAVKEDSIEIQGDKHELVVQHLTQMGIRCE